MSLHSQSRKATRLVIVGGGKIPSRVSRHMLDLARGAQSNVIVCPVASAHAQTGEAVAEEVFRSRHDLHSVSVLDFRLHDPDSDAACAHLAGCDLFFFTGGDQRTALKVLRGTRFERRFKERWASGEMVVAGTSAGLQIQAGLALTGDFRLPERDAGEEETRCTVIATGNVVLEKGFGLLPQVILDQHFVARQRQNRLFSAVLDNRDHLGVGVDEGTALVFEGFPGERVRPRVLGESCVFYLDASRAVTGIRANGELTCAKDLVCGLVWEGSEFPCLIELGVAEGMSHLPA